MNRERKYRITMTEVVSYEHTVTEAELADLEIEPWIFDQEADDGETEALLEVMMDHFVCVSEREWSAELETDTSQ